MTDTTQANPMDLPLKPLWTVTVEETAVRFRAVAGSLADHVRLATVTRAELVEFYETILADVLQRIHESETENIKLSREVSDLKYHKDRIEETNALEFERASRAEARVEALLRMITRAEFITTDINTRIEW